MDVTDYRIIEILQKDGRISMKDLGKIVGLTSPAVSERVKRLEESGVIEGYKAIVNPDALGRVIKAFIHIALPSDKYELFLETARKDPRIVECHHITGDDCSLLKVIVKDMYELENVIDSIKSIGTTKTSVILSTPLPSNLIIIEENTISAIRHPVIIHKIICIKSSGNNLYKSSNRLSPNLTTMYPSTPHTAAIGTHTYPSKFHLISE